MDIVGPSLAELADEPALQFIKARAQLRQFAGEERFGTYGRVIAAPAKHPDPVPMPHQLRDRFNPIAYHREWAPLLQRQVELVGISLTADITQIDR